MYMENQFNDKDPWHANAHLMFGFQCVDCDAEIGIESVPSIDLDNDFLGFCLKVSSVAQCRGWSFVDDFSFRCPKCTALQAK